MRGHFYHSRGEAVNVPREPSAQGLKRQITVRRKLFTRSWSVAQRVVVFPVTREITCASEASIVDELRAAK